MINIKNTLLDEINHTRMQKSYKMAVLLCMLKDGDLAQELAVSEIARFFRILYRREPFSLDLNDPSNKDLCEWSLSRIEQFVIRNPLNHLVETSGGVFYLLGDRFGIAEKHYRQLDPALRFSEVEERVYERLEKYFMIRYGYHGAI